MKIKLLYFTGIIAFLSITTFSFSSGPTASMGDLTGSPLSSNNCTQCHAASGSFSPTMTITVRDSLQQVVTEYTPGASYEITFQGTASSAQFGMQGVLLDGTNAEAGSLANPSSGSKLTTSSGVTYLEHSQRSTTGTFTVDWTAPTVGTGNVDVYAVLNAVNNNGTTSGDNVVQASVTLTEALGTSVTALQTLEYNVYPNPVLNKQFFVNGVEGDAVIFITNMMGQRVFLQDVTLEANSPFAVTLPELPQGVYNVMISQEGAVGTKQLIVQ